jgi:hypothetical protein
VSRAPDQRHYLDPTSKSPDRVVDMFAIWQADHPIT